MGVSGTLEYFSDLMSSSGHKHKKRKQLQTVELKVRMDCDGCELKKVTVTGYVETNKVLKKAKSTGKKAEIWPYVPYNLVAQPYAVTAYDKKAPPGYVRKVDNNVSSTATVTRYEDPYITMFSDENPNACSVM
ncbi:hypothetical protein Goshw_028411 [Gossypium schwendimanii]|uniref:HMA domain-containing protein n=1 Tax=Gossypium schwendimanii TaxID=34291 RepID=A0A7J9MYR4_GOSSC|nr:hypothetical protein [Gossypium schwendimanii]